MEKLIRKVNPLERYRERSKRNEMQKTHRSLVSLFTSPEFTYSQLDPSYKGTDDLFRGRPVWITRTIDLASNKDAMREYYSRNAAKMTNHYDPQTAREIQIEALRAANEKWVTEYPTARNRIERIILWNGKEITGQLLEGLQNPPT